MNQIKIDARKATKDLQKAFSQLSDGDIAKSTARAINQTLLKTRSEASRKIRSIYNFSPTQVNSNLFVIRSNYKNLTGYIKAASFTLALNQFNPVEIKGGVQTKRAGGRNGAFASKKIKSKTEGVVIEIIKGQKQTLTSAFLAFQKTGNAAVSAHGSYSSPGFSFNADSKVKSMRGPSLYGVLKGDNVFHPLEAFAIEQYKHWLLVELNKRLSQIA